MKSRIARILRKLANWLDPVASGRVSTLSDGMEPGGGGGPKEPK